MGLAVVGYFTVKANLAANDAKKAAGVGAAAATEAKNVGHDNTTRIEAVAVTARNTQRMSEAVHTLVNSTMSQQLRISSGALQRVADLTKDPADILAAQDAHKSLDAHLAQQAIVDSKPPPTSTTTGFGTGTPADQAMEEMHNE